MCARGGYKGGGKTPAPKERDKPRCRLAVGAYFLIPDMIILSPSKEATTLLLFRSTPRAAAQGFGIESLKPTEPEPPLLAIKLSSLIFQGNQRAKKLYNKYQHTITKKQLGKLLKKAAYHVKNFLLLPNYGYRIQVMMMPKKLYKLH